MKMMKRIFIFILLTGLIVSCKKETSSGFVINNNLQINDTTWNNSSSTQSLAKEITDDISLTELVDTLMVSNVGFDDDDKIFNNDKYRVSIPKNSLVNSITNKTFIKGAVKIKMQATTTKGNFIRNFCTSFVNGHQNQSVGFFNVRLFYNDTLMNIKAGSYIHLLVKDSLINPNSRYVSIFKGNGYDITDDNFKWSMDSSSYRNLAYWDMPGSNNHIGYDIKLSKLGWVSLLAPDNAVPNPNNKINVYMPVNFTNKNTVVYAVQNGTKNVSRLNADFPTRTFSLANLPFGQNVTLVSISKIDNQYYLGYSTVNYSSNKTIFNIVPQEITIANVIDYLNAL